MKATHLIVDGYCLLYRDPELQPLIRDRMDLARHRLVEKVARICDALAERTTIVFDGQGRERDEIASRGGLEILYSHGDETADTVIELMATSAKHPGQIRVVTSDLAEIHVVTAAGAEAMSCAEFIDRCTEQERRARHRIHETRRRAPVNRLGDHFP